MKETKQMQVAENLKVNVIPNSDFEFLMTTADVALGYGISSSTLRDHRRLHADELIEGKHFFTSVEKTDLGCKSSNYPPVKRMFWTKRGIVRLGFFIKSERAKMFRDWAEDLVISITEQSAQVEQLKLFPEPLKRRHNRLTPERMISILEDVAQIDNRVLRLSIVDKLTKQ